MNRCPRIIFRPNFVQSRPFSRYLSSCLVIATFAMGQGEVQADSDPQSDLFELSLEELSQIRVTTPSRVEESRDLAASAVYVFDADTIRKRGFQSLGDLLRVVPGFTVFHKGLHLVVGVRGLHANENEKVTLLVNGRESNNVQEPDFLNGPINLQTLERVEVVVGPSSFFQRANTLAATINIITKKMDGVELSISGGTDTPYSVNAVVGNRWSTERFITGSFTIERKDGFDAWDAVYKQPLAGFKETGQLDRSFFGVIEGQMGGSWGQLTAYESNHPELGLSQRVDRDGNRIYQNARYRDQMFLVNLKHHMNVNENLSLDALFDAGYKKVARLNNTAVVGPGLEVRYAQYDYSGEFALTYIGKKNHDIYTGLQFSFEDNLKNFAIRNGTNATLISPSNNSHAVGGYIYDRWQVTDRFKAEGGLRFDYNSLLVENQAYNWGGRLAFAYETLGKQGNWVTKLIANRAVRYPSAIAALNEAWGIDKPLDAPGNFFNRSAPASKAEILTTVEWQNIVYWKKTRLSTNLYYQYLKDFISFDFPHTNVGKFSGHGIEIEIRQAISEKFNIWLNASKVNSQLKTGLPSAAAIDDTDGTGRIIGSPGYTVNAGFNAEITDHFTLTGQFRYFTDQAAFQRPELVFKEVDHQAYVDLTANYVSFLAENIEIGFTVQNLFDNRHHVAVQWQKNQYKPRGRSLLLNFQVRF